MKKILHLTILAGSLVFAPQTAQAQNFAPVQTNPFSLTDIGNYSAPTFADLDNDGDLDMLAGEESGNLLYFENTGSAATPVFAAVQTNPFSLTNIGNYASPTFIDFDNDGDMDLFAGEQNGNFYYFENTGTAATPVFDAVQTNPFSLTDIGNYSSPTFVDLDNDGDMDVIAGEEYGDFYFFGNIGTAAAPVFAAALINPSSLTDIGKYATPTFADLDNDGDMDLLAGEGNGDFFYFENLVPTAAAVQTNPFSLTNIGTYSNPTFADLDNDGDMDLLSGDQYGNFYYFENMTTVGIDENTLFNKVSVYPNPNQGMVNVDLGTLKELTIKVINVNGQLIYLSKNINTPTFQFELNEAAGIYFMEINTQGESQHYKLIKE